MKRTKKKAIAAVILMLYMLSCAGYAWAAKEKSESSITDRIGEPIVVFDKYGGNTTEDIITIIEFSDKEGASETKHVIKTSDSAFKPRWEKIPITRYWFDITSNVMERWMGLIPHKTSDKEIASRIYNMLANGTFFISTTISRLSIELLLTSFNSQILVSFGEDAIEASKTIWSGEQENNVKNTLFMLAIVASGFYFIYKLVRFRFSDVIKAVGVTILMIALIFVYFANAGKILDTATGVTNTISSAVFSIIPANNSAPIDNSMQSGLVGFADQAWSMLVVKPWAYGEFGTTNINELKMTYQEENHLERNVSDDIKDSVTKAERIDQVVLGLPIGTADRNAAVNVFQDTEIDHGKHPQTVTTLGPGGALTKNFIAIISIVASLIFTIFVFIIGFFILTADITVLFCLVIAPFLAVAAVVPETGWNIALTWVKRFASALFAKIIYGIYAGVVFLVCSIILSTSGDSEFPFIFKMILFCITLLFAIFQRKKFIELITGVVGINREQKSTEGTATSFIKYNALYRSGKDLYRDVKSKMPGNKQGGHDDNKPKNVEAGNNETEKESNEINKGQNNKSKDPRDYKKKPINELNIRRSSEKGKRFDITKGNLDKKRNSKKGGVSGSRDNNNYSNDSNENDNNTSTKGTGGPKNNPPGNDSPGGSGGQEEGNGSPGEHDNTGNKDNKDDKDDKDDRDGKGGSTFDKDFTPKSK